MYCLSLNIKGSEHVLSNWECYGSKNCNTNENPEDFQKSLWTLFQEV